jgi:hypothetical protein
MPRPVDSRHAGFTSSSKRIKKSTALVSHNATTGLFTIAAGLLNELAPNDTIQLSTLTGGSGLTAGVDYFLCGPRWNLGATTFSVSTLPNGSILTGGSNATAGTVSSGSLTRAEDGVLSGNYISPDSPLGR